MAASASRHVVQRVERRSIDRLIKSQMLRPPRAERNAHAGRNVAANAASWGTQPDVATGWRRTPTRTSDQGSSSGTCAWARNVVDAQRWSARIDTDRMTTFVRPVDPWEWVCGQLRDRILSGEYTPGQRLVETDLATQFGTSRGPVRTALTELESAGLVERRARRGTFVSALSDDDVEEIFSLWALIWPFAVRRAVGHMTGDDIERLRALVPPPPRELDIGEAIGSSIAFHRVIFELARHKRLLDIWDNLTAQAHLRAVMASSAQTRRIHGFNPIADVFERLEVLDADGAIAVGMSWNAEVRKILAVKDASSS
jgi:DNA-binding GntR family transcriptional regulator